MAKSDLGLWVVHSLLPRLPGEIVERLLENECFTDAFKIRFDPTLRVGRGSVRLSDIVSTVQRVEAHAAPVGMETEGGGSLRFECQDEAMLIRLCEDGIDREVHYAPLGLVSGTRGVRIASLKHLKQECGPTFLLLDAWDQVVSERALSLNELVDVVRALDNSIEGHFGEVRSTFLNGSLRLEDLCPKSLSYYEELCGPDADGVEAEFYFTSKVPRHRCDLLARDFRKGLLHCMVSALRVDLCPGKWLSHIPDDELWEALRACRPQEDPVSLVAAIDIALCRTTDERFRQFAESAINQVVDGEAAAVDSNMNELISALLQWTTGWVNLLPGAMSRPPYWRRFASWIHAIQMARILGESGVAVSELRDMVGRTIRLSGALGSLLDLRWEPRIAAYDTSPTKVAGETLARLHLVVQSHCVEGNTVPSHERVAEAVAKRIQADPFAVISPGPLEGHTVFQPRSTSLDIPGEPTDEELLGRFAGLSRIAALGENALGIVRRIVCVGKSLEATKLLSEESLFSIGEIAVSEGDSELAEALAERVVASAAAATAGQVVGHVSLLVMLSSVVEEGRRPGWLGDTLTKYALYLPAGTVSRICGEVMRELMVVADVEGDQLGKALSVAVAGSY